MAAAQDNNVGSLSGNTAETTQGTSAEYPAEDRGGSGWVTTEVAAAALGVTPRTVREYIKSGRLGAKAEGKGVNKTWLVTIDTVQRLREARRSSADSTRKNRGESGGVNPVEPSAVDTGEALRDLITRLEVPTAEAADYKARLELTAQAESTLREALERERQRADKAERRAEELEAKLVGSIDLRNAPENPEAVQAEATAEMPSGTEGSQQPTPQRSWLYRFF